MDITERKRAQEALQEINGDLERRVDERTAELRVLASRLADAQEEERQRIAEGLHDEVCQLLAACQLKLAEARDSKDIEKRNRLVDAADRILNEASDEVRGLTFELSAASLFDGGFAAAARDLCAYMTESHGVTFEVDCANEDLGIPERLRPTLYHSLRELLHNVVRHAGVDHARCGSRRRWSVAVVGCRTTDTERRHREPKPNPATDHPQAVSSALPSATTARGSTPGT